MTIRTILVPVDGSEAAKPVMECGLALGRDLEAHVDVLHVRPDPNDTIPLLGEGMSVSMIEDMIELAEKEGVERTARGRRMFDDLVKNFSLPVKEAPETAGASAQWSEEVGRDDEVTARRGRLTDLIVVGRPTPSSEASSTMTLWSRTGGMPASSRYPPPSFLPTRCMCASSGGGKIWRTRATGRSATGSCSVSRNTKT